MKYTGVPVNAAAQALRWMMVVVPFFDRHVQPQHARESLGLAS